jgi:hypothetical protein
MGQWCVAPRSPFLPASAVSSVNHFRICLSHVVLGPTFDSICRIHSICCSYKGATVAPQVLACVAAFFSAFTVLWSIADVLAVLVSIPIVVLVLLPACIRISKATYYVAGGLCLLNVLLKIFGCVAWVRSMGSSLCYLCFLLHTVVGCRSLHRTVSSCWFRLVRVSTPGTTRTSYGG